MNAEQSPRVAAVVPLRLLDQIRELGADVVALIREARQCDAYSSNLDDDRARNIEDVNVPVREQSSVRTTRTLVITRDDEHRDPLIRDADERLVCLVRDARVRSRAIEDVAAVDDKVNIADHRGRERRSVVREKIESAPAPSDPRPEREVEAEVGIGQK